MKLQSALCVAMILASPTVAFAADNAPLLPAPENAIMEPLASHLKINGVDMRAVQFHVGAEEERLRAHFVESCAKLSGSYTENQLRNEHIQGCITPPYSLTSQWHMEGDVAYGTLTSLRMDQKIEHDTLPGDLPLPANAQVLQDVESSDGGIRGRVLHVHVDAPATIVHASLDRALLTQRWQPLSTVHNSGSVISMQKGRRRLDIVIGEDGTGKSRLIIVLDQR